MLLITRNVFISLDETSMNDTSILLKSKHHLDDFNGNISTLFCRNREIIAKSTYGKF